MMYKDLYLADNHEMLNQGISINFTDYLKCNISYGGKNSERDLMTFMNAYRFIEGGNKCEKWFYKALTWYYDDVYNYLNRNAKYINKDYSFLDNIEVFNKCSKLNIDVSDLAEQLSNYMNNKPFKVLYDLDYDNLLCNIPTCLIDYKYKYIVTEMALIKFILKFKINVYLEVS